MKRGEKQQGDDRFMGLVVHRMKELRVERRLIQEHVADRTGLNISQYEAKRNYPSLLFLSKLCKFYGITLDEFFVPLAYPPKG